MSSAKVQLSTEELELIENSDFILTKNRILEKTATLLGDLAISFQQESNHFSQLPAEALVPKISRGERYEGLPYLILDYPRYFKSHEVFAVRTMFWWGHHISLTLHLKGLFKSVYQPSIFQFHAQRPSDWLLQTSGDEWMHHNSSHTHEAFNNITVDQLKDLYTRLPYIKLSYFLSVDQWNEAATLLDKRFKVIISAMKH